MPGPDTALLFSAVANSRLAMLLSDPNLPDSPTVLVNRAFCELTGYAPEDIVGRNSRLLQGPLTDPQAVAQIRAALARAVDCTVRIYNYRKDGTGFWNDLFIGPVFDAEGRLTHFLGAQTDVTRRVHDETTTAVRAARQAPPEAGRLFNDLLTVVLAGAELAAIEPPSRRQARGLERVIRAARLTGRLLSDRDGAGTPVAPALDNVLAVLRGRGIASTLDADPALAGGQLGLPPATATLLLLYLADSVLAGTGTTTLTVRTRLNPQAGRAGAEAEPALAGDLAMLTFEAAAGRPAGGGPPEAELVARAMGEWGGRLSVYAAPAGGLQCIAALPLRSPG